MNGTAISAVLSGLNVFSGVLLLLNNGNPVITALAFAAATICGILAICTGISIAITRGVLMVNRSR